MKDGDGEPEAEELEDPLVAEDERRRRRTNMIAAAAVITRAVAARPSATATALSPVRSYSSRMRESRNTS